MCNGCANGVQNDEYEDAIGNYAVTSLVIGVACLCFITGFILVQYV